MYAVDICSKVVSPDIADGDSNIISSMRLCSSISAPACGVTNDLLRHSLHEYENDREPYWEQSACQSKYMTVMFHSFLKPPHNNITNNKCTDVALVYHNNK